MKFDRQYAIGIASIVFGGLGLILWRITFLVSRDAEMSRKISSQLELLPTCNFDPEKEKQVGEILLRAKKAIDVDGNYGDAAALLNSVWGEMWQCRPTLQANADLMLIIVLVMIIIVGIIAIVSRYREKHKNENLRKD